METLLSICMIVKNEERNLPLTLPSCIEGVDEVIVLDTGSSDRTREIARELGAKVYEFPWRNDFSAARNQSLKYAQGEFILWLDADEYVPASEFKKLKEVLKDSSSDLLYVKVCECPRGETSYETFYTRDKIFRNHKGFKFIRPINEQLQRPEGISVSEIDFNIFHWGGPAALDEETKKRKWERNVTLLEKAAAENPEDSSFGYRLASQYVGAGLYQKAAELYRKVIQLLPEGWASTSARCQLSRCLILLGKVDEALEVACEACRLDPQNPEAASTKASILICHQQKYEEAISLLLPVCDLPLRSEHGEIVNLKFYRYFPSYLLEMAKLKLGEKNG